jgi:hypothetical protein
VLLVEAEADAVVADFGEFAPDPRFRQLVPQVDYAQDIASFPLLVLQVCQAFLAVLFLLLFLRNSLLMLYGLVTVLCRLRFSSVVVRR